LTDLLACAQKSVKLILGNNKVQKIVLGREPSPYLHIYFFVLKNRQIGGLV